MIEDTEWRDWQNEVEAAFVSASGSEAIFRMTDRNREWAKLKQAAESAAKRDGVNTGSPETVRAYVEAAMRDYAEAVRNGGARELLPNTDWRIRAARRHGDKIVAAMLYREAADAINAETAKAAAEAAAAEAGWSEYYEQQEAAIIAAYERNRAKKRPGRYAHHGNGAGISKREAAEEMFNAGIGTSIKANEKQLWRWEARGGNNNGYPGRTDRATFDVWLAQYAQRKKHGESTRAMMKRRTSYKATATEAANMKLTGEATPHGLW